MADSSKLFRFSIDIESSFGAGGSSWTDLPVSIISRPKAVGEEYSLPVVTASLGMQPKYYVKKYWEMEVGFYLKGSGTAGTAPEFDKLMRICGLAPVPVALTSQSYKVMDSAFESGSIKVNLNGLQYLINGAKVYELSIPMKGGSVVLCTAKIRGLYAEPTAVAWGASTITDTTKPLLCTTSVLTLDGTSYVMPEFNLKFATNVDELLSVNASSATGVDEITSVDRSITGDFMVVRAAGNDTEFWTKLTGSTVLAMLQTGWGVPGNKVDIDMANLQLTDLEPIEIGGREGYKGTFQVNSHATADSEFRIKFI
jgi:hypothetical protein